MRLNDSPWTNHNKSTALSAAVIFSSCSSLLSICHHIGMLLSTATRSTTADCDAVDCTVVFYHFYDPHEVVDCRPEHILLLLVRLAEASSFALQQHKRSQQTQMQTRWEQATTHLRSKVNPASRAVNVA